MLKELKKRGDRVVIHGLAGKRSNRQLDSKIQQKAVAIPSLDVYRRFGPTLACEYLGKKHGIHVSLETARKELRVAGVKTLQQANEYLAKEFLPWWNRTLVVEPSSADAAHRKLGKGYDLAAILSHVEKREVKNDYTIQFEGHRYGIRPESIPAGLRGREVRVERRLDSAVAVRFQDRYLRVSICTVAPKAAVPVKAETAGRKSGDASRPRPKSGWMKGFWEKPAPPIGRAIEISNATS